MPLVKIEPQGRFDFNVGGKGKFLLIRNTDDGVKLASDDFRASGISTGDAINVAEYDGMRFENDSHVVVEVEYQISDLPIQTSVTQNLTIKRIIEPIQFEASVRVVDGLKVEVIASSGMDSLPDKTINAGQTVSVSSNKEGRKQTLIQVISDDVTTLRVGGAGVSANAGALLKGSINAPASMVIDNAAEVYIHNASAKAAKISVTEVFA
ncbi:hypothetical protein NB496_09205 [Vibrio alginolyticus]|uniref:hypothetical protein n=1 Tax=Vibrio harveyi group TaxID=717610 RepID=UPI00215C880C|nr:MULTISPECIES: hypothetical protein [Vibrio harveyi group]MCR9640807.1 hypothetical protein [Vibrio alginolyticus]MCS0356355.1 hypothetical protein [Vibrio diabolicus]